MRRQFFRELQFAREKSSYLMQEDSVVENLFEALAGVLSEDGTEEEPDAAEDAEDLDAGEDAQSARRENAGGAGKNSKNPSNDYKNV